MIRLFAVLALLATAAPLAAQSAGQTGAQVLQFNAGARAAGLSGAYTAASGDADAIFYNPAGIARLRHGASLAYESYATDVAFGSLAGFTRLGHTTLGLSVAYLDAGAITEIVPDPEFGGLTGTATGNTVTASETALRLALALPLGGSIRLGAAVGLVSIGLAELSEHAPIADVGLQYDVSTLTISAALRNLGGELNGDPLPTEIRVGAWLPVTTAAGFGVNIFADAISRIRESSLGFVTGVEAGIVPSRASGLGAVARIGYDGDANHLSSLHLGAGLSLQTLSFDYAYQNFDHFGAVHRFGLRWTAR